jgi:pyridoxal phosphate enzyme (YggS family)
LGIASEHEGKLRLKQQIEALWERIRRCAEDCGRSVEEIRLVAVSKTKPAERIVEAINAGVSILGENYIQEAQEKASRLADYPVAWHFVGHLQSNKAKQAVQLFDLIHSVDSLKLAKALARHAAAIGKVQKILIQINLDDAPSKSGIAAAAAIGLIGEIAAYENLSVRGLMTMPSAFGNPERVRPCFAALRRLRDQVQGCHIPHVDMRELSMGMTGDFETAIEEGATLLRIGTAIFGRRE